MSPLNFPLLPFCKLLSAFPSNDATFSVDFLGVFNRILFVLARHANYFAYDANGATCAKHALFAERES